MDINLPSDFIQVTPGEMRSCLQGLTVTRRQYDNAEVFHCHKRIAGYKLRNNECYVHSSLVEDYWDSNPQLSA